ncbi:uncharacterized protein E5676_scaffold640G00260 [Cucumis melo var. makuwa]|uniref:Reverse transcriptase domain-containing protein n=1 Tax=Cucumis melo var. makuwa TaxID=1194695 RepID=A0A5D3DQM1_CUCMM|nr:uncharacterized protein E6C27_scaffold80G00300 [Cucumis melo var. makuwa]TYK25785.1 uncharacterized protein E5676_scaffold640G00260 [Cucumis melo var. makuwa]
MKDGFNPKAYKLMAKAGYDFTTHTEFESLKILEQPKLSSIQKKLLREGHTIPVSRKGLGYKSPEPICITRNGKEKVVNNNHITVEEVKRHGEGETSCHHNTILEELEIETPEEDVEDVPQNLEDGGQSTIDELKEEMSGLDPKVAVHHLAIKPGYRSIKIMIDATTRHEALSFMDVSSGYNQIQMALSDEEITAFKTPKGIYCYKCYIDDLVVKSKRRQDHLKDVKVVLDRLRKYQLRMNPLKCTFSVTSGKFLGFIVRHRAIEIDQPKIDVIQKMPRPKSLHDLRSLQG